MRNLINSGECSISNWISPAYCRSWCVKHYSRHLRNGDPLATINNPPGSGPRSPNGYKMISVKGKQYLEHRIIMEQILNRKLLPTETVHHKNGKRTDNRVENLELWNKSHPAGQRPEDLVKWAYEILEVYSNFKEIKN